MGHGDWVSSPSLGAGQYPGLWPQATGSLGPGHADWPASALKDRLPAERPGPQSAWSQDATGRPLCTVSLPTGFQGSLFSVRPGCNRTEWSPQRPPPAHLQHPLLRCPFLLWHQLPRVAAEVRPPDASYLWSTGQGVKAQTLQEGSIPGPLTMDREEEAKGPQSCCHPWDHIQDMCHVYPD